MIRKKRPQRLCQKQTPKFPSQNPQTPESLQSSSSKSIHQGLCDAQRSVTKSSQDSGWWSLWGVQRLTSKRSLCFSFFWSCLLVQLIFFSFQDSMMLQRSIHFLGRKRPLHCLSPLHPLRPLRSSRVSRPPWNCCESHELHLAESDVGCSSQEWFRRKSV